MRPSFTGPGPYRVPAPRVPDVEEPEDERLVLLATQTLPTSPRKRRARHGAEPSAADIVLYGEARAMEIAEHAISRPQLRLVGCTALVVALATSAPLTIDWILSLLL